MNGETRENVVATLDLHGYTKENAISTMTRFLSEVTSDRTASQLSKVEHRRGSSGTTAASATTSTANAVSDIHHGIWVLIITGTGKHSTQGPVLRNSVKATLDKRCMTYQLVDGKGGFLVRADSGHQLYDVVRMPLDAKVIVCNDDGKEGTSSSGIRYHRQCSAESAASGMDTRNDPLPSQVQAEEEEFQQARQQSAHEDQLRRNQCVLSQEEEQLKQAMSISLSQTEVDKSQRQKSIQEEEEEIQFALEQSVQEEQEQQLQEEEALKRALAASQLQQEEDEYHRACRCRSDNVEEEEDEELRRVLHLSNRMAQMMTDEELIRVVMEKSMQEF